MVTTVSGGWSSPVRGGLAPYVPSQAPWKERHRHAGIVNLSGRGMLVVSVARQLGSGNSFARLLCCPAQQSGAGKRRPGSAKLTMPTGGPLSSPGAAQRCAKGAGLDSGPPVAAQSAMPVDRAAPAVHRTQTTFHRARRSMAPHLQPRISTSLTDVTHRDHKAIRPIYAQL
jgi:hypothetical protein